jgi:NAD(P)-dependent dehydrogenase (short-subunit alcohol dehydrogenase family)
MSVFRQSSSALITGGASGIGLAVAQHCLSCSMRVTVVDNNQATLDLAQQRLKGDVRCVRADVSDASAWDSLREKTGEVDFLMLNAGRAVKGTWGDDAYFKQVSKCGFSHPSDLFQSNPIQFQVFFFVLVERRGRELTIAFRRSWIRTSTASSMD